MKRFLLRGLLYLSAGFLLLFLLRLGYGYLTVPRGGSDGSYQGWASPNANFNNNLSLEKRNYASTKKEYVGQTVVPDQKYEKIGTLLNQTEKFETDETRLRTLITDYKALVQSEQRSGLPGNQVLQLGIGVIPEKFDDLILDFKKIGKLVSLQINKTDKTNEYKDLEAKKTSLLQTHSALIGLKSKGGKIDELMQLENRILEIEEQIQGLGVRLGEFDAENEFCTVKITLTEREKAQGIPLAQRLKVAFEWTVTVYATLIVAAFFGVLMISLLFWLVPRVIALANRWNPA